MPDPIKAPYHFEIKYKERPADYRTQTVGICNTQYEINYIVSGTLRTITSNTSYDAHTGDISTTPLNVYYQGISLSKGTYKNVVIKFHKEMASPFIKVIGDMAFEELFSKWLHRFPTSSKQKIEHIISNMLDEYNHYNELSELLLQGMLHNLLAIMIRERIPNTNQDMAIHKANPLILKALNFMENNYLEHPSLKETAAHISISPEYFSRLFKDALGKSYCEYQNRIKLRYAYQLLEQTNLSVGQVAEQTGFSNANYMCDVMKRYIGMSPSQFRKLALKRVQNKEVPQFQVQYDTNQTL